MQHLITLAKIFNFKGNYSKVPGVAPPGRGGGADIKIGDILFIPLEVNVCGLVPLRTFNSKISTVRIVLLLCRVGAKKKKYRGKVTSCKGGKLKIPVPIRGSFLDIR